MFLTKNGRRNNVGELEEDTRTQHQAWLTYMCVHPSRRIGMGTYSYCNTCFPLYIVLDEGNRTYNYFHTHPCMNLYNVNKSENKLVYNNSSIAVGIYCETYYIINFVIFVIAMH